MQKFMKAALTEAYKGIKKGEGGPFGACIVRKGRVVAVGHNTVLKTNNPVNHAEVNAIAKVCAKLKKCDLSDCEIYSTTEPCPMCFSALHWAKIPKIIYGTSIADVKKLGFNELAVSNLILKKLGKTSVKIRASFMREECLELLNFWEKLNLSVY